MFFRYNLLAYMQAFTIGIIFLLCCVFYNFQAAYSASLGGLAWILPCYCFGRKQCRSAFPPQPGKTPHLLLVNFYFYEVAKLTLSAILVILFINIFSLRKGSFIIGYAAAVMAIWFSPFIKERKKVTNV